MVNPMRRRQTSMRWQHLDFVNFYWPFLPSGEGPLNREIDSISRLGHWAITFTRQTNGEVVQVHVHIASSQIIVWPHTRWCTEICYEWMCHRDFPVSLSATPSVPFRLFTGDRFELPKMWQRRNDVQNSNGFSWNAWSGDAQFQLNSSSHSVATHSPLTGRYCWQIEWKQEKPMQNACSESMILFVEFLATCAIVLTFASIDFSFRFHTINSHLRFLLQNSFRSKYNKKRLDIGFDVMQKINETLGDYFLSESRYVWLNARKRMSDNLPE